MMLLKKRDHDDLNELYSNPYVSVSFPLGRLQVSEAVEAFFDFLQLQENIKGHIDLKIAERHRRGDLGYKRRDAGDDIYNDSKDFFHFHPIILEKYKEFIDQNLVVARFLNHAMPIWQATYDTVSHVLQRLENEHPGLHGKVFATDEVHIVLRFLRYEYSQAGRYLAKPHFDSGSFTLAIAESCPGLRIGTGPHDLELVHHEEHQALFMISSNYEKLTDTKCFFPGWHDVVQLDDSQIGKPYARWAVVAFIDGHGVEALSRSETHKWYPGESK